MKAPTRAQLVQISRHRTTKLLVRAGLIYLALCIVVVVPLLNWGTKSLYHQQTGRTLESGLIIFNPFTFSITASELADHNPDGSLLWSVNYIHLNFSPLQSLFHFAPALDGVDVDGLQIHPHLLANNRWNFSDILDHQAKLAQANPASAPTGSDELPELLIDHIRIVMNALEFTDSREKTPFKSRIETVLLEVQDFSTRADEGPIYDLAVTLPDTSTLSAKGAFSLNSAHTQGEVTLSNISLQPLWKYVKAGFNFTLENSVASGTGQYDVQWKKEVDWSIAQSQLTLTKNKLRSGKASARNAEVTLGSLALTGIAASSKTQKAEVAGVKADGLQLSSWSQGSDIGLLRALALTDNGSASSDKPWVVLVKSLAVNNAAIDWRTAELERTLKLRKLNFSAANIDTSGKQNMTVKLATIIDDDAQLTTSGGLNLTSLNGDFSSQLQNLPLVITQPLLAPYARVDIAAGKISTDVALQIRNGELTLITTKGTLTDAKLHPAAATQELVTWTNLQWNDTRIDFVEQKIDIPLATLSGFDSRFILKQDGTTNLQELVPATLPDAEPNKTAEVEKPWDFTLHKLELDKASFRFNDQSLTPNFTAAVQNFTGTLTGLSSDTSKPAVFKFHGDVDGYAPVNLQGHAQLLLPQPQLDARLDFENMDLGGLSGYSSTYAGWRIERGLLTANLHYRLKEGRIVGDNHIEMDQLKLGERVDNAQAADIPLRLALALLTDENGLATLDIGISGNTNEPNFDLGAVIRQAMRNTFVKIVKSPFTLLANLVGSKEDLGQLPFNSGSSQLLTTATRKLNSLQQALLKRPELRIEMNGRYDQVTDHRGLQAAQIKQQLLERGLSSADIKAKNERWQKAVAEEYRALKLDNDDDLSADQMYEQWLQTIMIAPEALTQLAAQRSINAKQFLVQQLKIEPNRVLINSKLDCIEAEACSRRIVKLDLSDLNQTLPHQ